MFEDFTNMYPVSKTLRFELIPVGKTQEHIEKKGIIGKDTGLAESYKKMKKTLDEYHKEFIDEALGNVSLTGLKEFYDLYTANAEVKKEEAYANKYKDVRTSLRKEVAECFNNHENFKRLNSKELIKEELQTWIEQKHPDLYFDKQFKNFTTYFKGYNENRMNMYSDEEKATAVSHRLIDENLPKFIDNIRVFDQIKDTAIAEHFPEICSAMEPWLNVTTLDELFTLENYNQTLTQKQIEAYNFIIGGRSEEKGKVQGLNEYINRYNQNNPEKKLPKLKMLFKQILSDRGTASWIPESFDSASELLNAVNDFYADYCGNMEDDLYNNALAMLPNADLTRVYIRNDAAMSNISVTLFNGKYGVLKDALGIDPEDKESYYSVADIQAALDDYAETLDPEINADFFKSYHTNVIASYFSGDAFYERKRAIDTAYKDAEKLLKTSHEDDYILTQEDKDGLKTLLDSLMEMLHFVKPLYLKADDELPKDDLFYGAFLSVYEKMQNLTKLYDEVRNFVTKKPYSTEKVKLNFSCSTLLDGWDVNKETDNLGILLIKDGKYYLGIMDKSNNKSFSKVEASENESTYQKVIYKLLPDPKKMLPKVFFCKKGMETFAPDKKIMHIYKTGTFKKGSTFSLKDCHTLIDFYKESIKTYGNWDKFDFRFSPTEQYKDINGFFDEISEQGYKLTYTPVSERYIDTLVDDGKLYLFQIYNKDFSPYAKGKPNLHTLYWRALFDEKNLSNVIYKLNGEAEVFYRKSSIAKKNQVIHKANAPINKKNPQLKGESSIFTYDIIKDRRYTVDKFQFHVPITMNFTVKGSKHINESVCEYLKNNPDVNIIGIDRGERHLLYLSMIDRNGKVVKDKNGKYIQYSLNTITGEYKDGTGKTVSFETPYHELLDRKEIERKEARESWATIENIKELKAGYLSQVVHHIAKLMTEYHAIVVLEDLNSGFKNGRKKVEKQVYQNFEKALIEKLNYLVFKDVSENEPGGLYKAWELTEKFESFKKLNKQNGFLFYVPAWNTSKIDPVTGFVDLLKPKTVASIKEAKDFFSRFDDIRYNAKKDYFEFSFDYIKFTDKAKVSRTKWTVCTFGDTRYVYNRMANGGRGAYETWNVTERMKALFETNGINYRSGDLREAIASQNQSGFFTTLLKLLKVTLAMRYSSAEDGKDFILSPVADDNGDFYCSEGRTDGLPQDADANGAFNIARKGLWVLEHIDKAKKYKDWTTKISNDEWLRFVQEKSR